MKKSIKNLTRIILGLFLTSIVINGLWFYSGGKHLGDIEKIREISVQWNHEVVELMILSAEVTHRQSDRALFQWHKKHKNMMPLPPKGTNMMTNKLNIPLSFIMLIYLKSRMMSVLCARYGKTCSLMPKFTSKRDQAVIEILTETDKQFFHFSVKDNGAGFNTDYVNKLFVLFQRLHGMEEFEGTGVGLAIVKRFIQKTWILLWIP
jgi:hypothetical protein